MFGKKKGKFNIGLKIKLARIELGMTQRDLLEVMIKGHKCSYSSNKISRIENGANMGVNTLIAISEAVKKPMYYFFE